jgi:hypothetical protein
MLTNFKTKKSVHYLPFVIGGCLSDAEDYKISFHEKSSSGSPTYCMHRMLCHHLGHPAVPSQDVKQQTTL